MITIKKGGRQLYFGFPDTQTILFLLFINTINMVAFKIIIEIIRLKLIVNKLSLTMFKID